MCVFKSMLNVNCKISLIEIRTKLWKSFVYRVAARLLTSSKCEQLDITIPEKLIKIICRVASPLKSCFFKGMHRQ